MLMFNEMDRLDRDHGNSREDLLPALSIVFVFTTATVSGVGFG